MANEPTIEFKGNAFKTKDFTGSNGSTTIVSVVCSPSYKNKQSGQWVELEPIYFDVRPYGREAEAQAAQIVQELAKNKSVRVLVNGTMTVAKSQQGGTFNHVTAKTLVVISARDKTGGNGGYQRTPQATPAPAADPWGVSDFGGDGVDSF